MINTKWRKVNSDEIIQLGDVQSEIDMTDFFDEKFDKRISYAVPIFCNYCVGKKVSEIGEQMKVWRLVSGWFGSSRYADSTIKPR